jgi:predicted ATPase
MSHGEGFLKFFNTRITSKGLYLIDEPEAALSPARQLSLIVLIQEAVKNKGSQFIIATHSPIIMAMQEAQILHFENNTISEINYTDTPHYQLTKAFMDNPERYLRGLEE